MFSAMIVQCLIAFFAYADAFLLHRNTRYCNNYPVALSASNIKEYLSEDSEFNDNINDDLDWRAFCAQLVRSEQNDPIDPNSKDSSHWAYDSGDLIERGSVVISIPSSDQIANDIDTLYNQCYRKSIILVLDVKPDFIQGIIFDRPTNIRVVEGMKLVRPEEEEACGDLGSSSRWKVWFGGEALGLYLDFPKIMCLHSVQKELALDVSEAVLPGILMTSFAGAEAIEKAGDAQPSDFWLFCRICGWETLSFYREMHEEGLWRIVSSDGGTILEELYLQRCEEKEEAAQEICDVDSDSRNAGIHTWEMLMDMIGRGAEACESADSFGDLMLREWATGVLPFTLNGGQSNMILDWPVISDEQNDIDSDGSDFDIHLIY